MAASDITLLELEDRLLPTGFALQYIGVTLIAELLWE